MGDGRHTIHQLINIANLDPRRGDEFARPMCKLALDEMSFAAVGTARLRGRFDSRFGRTA